MTRTLIRHHGRDSLLAASIGRDRKGVLSLALYVAAVVFAFVQRWASIVCLVIVPIMWFLPDRRIEKQLSGGEPSPD